MMLRILMEPILFKTTEDKAKWKPSLSKMLSSEKINLSYEDKLFLGI
jgi:hypothetical protein